jgi:hypothetical protein
MEGRREKPEEFTEDWRQRGIAYYRKKLRDLQEAGPRARAAFKGHLKDRLETFEHPRWRELIFLMNVHPGGLEFPPIEGQHD